MHVIALSNLPYCGSVTGFSLRESSASGSFLASFSVTQYHPSAWFMMRLRNIYSILLLVNQQFMYWLYDSVADRETGESLATWTPKFEGRCRCLKAFENLKFPTSLFLWFVIRISRSFVRDWMFGGFVAECAASPFAFLKRERGSWAKKGRGLTQQAPSSLRPKSNLGSSTQVLTLLCC